jgi:hypothetical protein
MFNSLFHADRIQHQLELLEDLGRMSRHVGPDGLVLHQLFQVALGDDQVR